jgi:hypothetical protein
MLEPAARIKGYHRGRRLAASITCYLDRGIDPSQPRSSTEGWHFSVTRTVAKGMGHDLLESIRKEEQIPTASNIKDQ